jgi:hypothetical protein
MSWSPTDLHGGDGDLHTYAAGVGSNARAFRHLTIEVLLPVNSVATSTPTLPAKLGFPETFRSNLSLLGLAARLKLCQTA